MSPPLLSNDYNINFFTKLLLGYNDSPRVVGPPGRCCGRRWRRDSTFRAKLKPVIVMAWRVVRNLTSPVSVAAESFGRWCFGGMAMRPVHFEQHHVVNGHVGTRPRPRRSIDRASDEAHGRLTVRAVPQRPVPETAETHKHHRGGLPMSRFPSSRFRSIDMYKSRIYITDYINIIGM